MNAETLLRLLLSVAVLAACVSDESEEPPAAPDPIGSELLGFTTIFGLPSCAEGHLYRHRDAVQLQCFASDGSFSWENHGSLHAQGQTQLEAALAEAAPDDTTPGDGLGCKSSELGAATFTLWVGEQPVDYPAGCPHQGIEDLDAVVEILLDDIADCVELDMLESVEDGCRAY